MWSREFCLGVPGQGNDDGLYGAGVLVIRGVQEDDVKGFQNCALR